MTTATIKVKNGLVRLPKKLQKAWADAEVFVRATKDTVVLKRIKQAVFWNTWQKLKGAGKEVTATDIKKAVVWARKKPTK